MHSRNDAVTRGLAYEIFILLISVLSIVNLGILIFTAVTNFGAGAPGDVILVMEFSLTPIFLGDFLYRLYRAESTRRYLIRGYGWADLISIVPLLRFFRLVRISRVIRQVRSGGSERAIAELGESRAGATFALTIFLVFVVLEVAGASIFAVEAQDPAANIQSGQDALWWGLVTITTVGYGDQYPVTSGGRVIGTFLLFAGIALFSVLTGFIANAFLAPRRRRRAVTSEHAEAINRLRELLDEQQERSDAIRQQLDDLERSMARGQESPPTA